MVSKELLDNIIAPLFLATLISAASIVFAVIFWKHAKEEKLW